LVMVLTVLQVGICVVRWRAVLEAINGVLSVSNCFRLYLVGIFFNQALPSAVGGDAVRIYRAYQEGLSGVIVLMYLDRLPSKYSHWRFVQGLAILAADTRRVFLSNVYAFKVLSWSLMGHINIALIVFLLGFSIGLEITWFDCMVLMPPVLLMMTLPISIAGWGVREQAMVAAFALVNVPGEGALALSIMFGLVGLVSGLPGGIVWLVSSDKKILKINEFSDH